MAEETHSFLKNIRSILQIFLTFLILGICTPIVVLAVIFSLGTLRNVVIQYIGLAIGRTILWVNGVRLTTQDEEKKPDHPVIYIANHSSTLDLFVVIGLGLKRVRFVGKKQLMYNPFFFLMGLITDQIFIERENTQKAISVLNKSVEKIKTKNLSLFVAPEGTRKHPGRVGPFKKGPFRMAIELSYPIVPIFIQGARELCSGDSLIVKPGQITAIYHDKIDTSSWELETLNQHINDVRDMYIEWDKKYQLD